MHVLSVDGHDCMNAINSPIRDFEDALAVVCAEKEELNYIITNDKNFLNETVISVSTISPVDFLLRF